MANPIMPSGRRRNSYSSEIRPPVDGILDLEGDRHTVDGDWVEDNPSVIEGTHSMSEMEADISRLFSVNLGLSEASHIDPIEVTAMSQRMSREAIVDEYNNGNRERRNKENKEKSALREMLVRCKEKFNDAISGLEL